MEHHGAPPMDPNTSEATSKQLEHAIKQGEAYGNALHYMTGTAAQDAGEQQAGHYLIGYAVEEAEGMYEWVECELVWRAPGEDEILHVEVSVRDAGDGRFMPSVKVFVTLTSPDGNEIGPHEQPLLWHPMIYHYGRNCTSQKMASTGCTSGSSRRRSCAMTRSTASASSRSSRWTSTTSRSNAARISGGDTDEGR